MNRGKDETQENEENNVRQVTMRKSELGPKNQRTWTKAVPGVRDPGSGLPDTRICVWDIKKDGQTQRSPDVKKNNIKRQREVADWVPTHRQTRYWGRRAGTPFARSRGTGHMSDRLWVDHADNIRCRYEALQP
jgi:hypothetical protein